MKTISLIISSMILCLAAHAQEGDLEGIWVGHITQTPGVIHDDYYFLVNLDIIDNEIHGTTTISFFQDASMFGTIAMDGTIHNQNIEFKEHTVMKAHLHDGYFWCLKNINLKPVRDNGKLMLKGSWNSDGCPTSGIIELERIPML